MFRYNEVAQHVVTMMIEGMQIQPPRLVISISGDQNEVADPEHLTRILMNGFSETDDLWVITNGTVLLKAVPRTVSVLLG